MYKDNTDQKIIEYLKEDSRESFVDIGKKLKLSESAVRRRVKNLVTNGTIKKFTLEILNPQKDERILDLGCGCGAFIAYCSMLGADCVGIDYSPNIVESANNFLRTKGLKGEARVGDVEDTDFPDNSFDKIISCDLYEHLTKNSQIRMLKEAYRVLKPGGFILIKTPNLAYLRLSILTKRLLALTRFRNPFRVQIAHTKYDSDEEETGMHAGLSTIFKLEKDVVKAGFFSYQLYHNLGTKLSKISPVLNRLLTQEVPFARDLFTEEIVIKAVKSKLSDFMPDQI